MRFFYCKDKRKFNFNRSIVSSVVFRFKWLAFHPFGLVRFNEIVSIQLTQMERERDREKETYRRALALRSINLFYVYFMVIILTFLFITRLLKWYGEVPPQVKMNLHWLIFLKWLKKNIHKQANSKRREYNRIIHLFWSDNQIPKVSKKFTENNLSK